MKRIFFLCVVLLAGMIAQAQKQFVVDPNAQQRTLNGSFNAIDVSGGIDIYLSQSEKEEIAVSASEDKFRDAIKTVVENNTLKIYYDGDKSWGFRNRQLKAYISFKAIEKLEASGASDIVVAGEIKVPSLYLKLSGASDFKGAVSVSNLKLHQSGASDVTISGVASIVSIDNSGASDIDGFDLITDVCNANVSGASDISITVNKELSAHASGSSDIRYKGSAVIKEIQSSGSSSVSKKNR